MPQDLGGKEDKMRKTALKAFTMIELLVVIAVIGVMATAVLSAINPLEQINKGTDTGYRSDSEQLLSAVDRYYSSLGYFPWQNGAQDTTNLSQAWGNVIALNTATGFINNLESTNEIKHGFTIRLLDPNRVPIEVMYNSAATSATMYACFTPKSNSFTTEAFNRCANTTATAGTPFDASSTACGGGVGGSTGCTIANKDCYVCLP